MTEPKKDIVIIPTYDRPEYLWVCLENLSKTYINYPREYWICEDNHIDHPKDFTTQIEMLATIREAERLLGKDSVKYIGRTPHSSYGNSFNLVEALKEASVDSPRFVYIVEDDVMVMPDFFDWNQNAQRLFNPSVTCAGRVNRSLNFPMNGPQAMDESVKDPMACAKYRNAYISWATCFPGCMLRYVLKHLGQIDPEEWRPGQEQDIQIQIFLYDCNSGGIVWPYVPRAYHMGWYSYHRTAGMKFNGTLEEKVRDLRKAISNQAKIREMAGIQDIDAFPKSPIVLGEGNLYLKAEHR